MLMEKLPPFALKRFLMGPEAKAARYDLSSSYCQPVTTETLLALDEGAQKTLAEAKLGYPGFRGSEALREDIAQLYDGRPNGLSAEQINVYAGGDDSIFAFMNACLAPGDHVIAQAPTYQSLYALPQALGCQVDLWQGREDEGWRLDVDELRALLRPETKAVVLNQPQNPTGALMPRDDFEAVFRLAEERGFLVFVDEIYRFLELDSSRALPAACEISPQGISLGATSKSLGLPGLRLGWLATGNQGVAAQLLRLRDYHNSTVSRPSEILTQVALSQRQEILSRNKALIAQNLEKLRAFLIRHGNLLTWQEPAGGTIGFLRLAEGHSADDLGRRLLAEAGILLPQSRYFEFGDQHLRIGFGTEAFEENLAALEAFLSNKL